MATDTAIGESTTAERGASGPVWCRPAGRHRKPRPRRVVLAVGGFALAAGALSLVRLAPDSVTGGGGTAEAEPRIDTSDTAATVGSVPQARTVSRSTTAAGTEASTSPSAPHTVSPSAYPSPSPSLATDPATGIPEAPWSPTASATPEPPTPTAPRPTPPPPTRPATHTPAPEPDPPGLCVPLVGLCVNGSSEQGG